MHNHRKILIVEDDQALRNLLSLRLSEKNFLTFTAENGNQALSICQQEKPSVLILDVNLPDILGVDIAEILNSGENQFGKPKIIILTGISYSIENPKERWIKDYGVCDFLTKPFDFDELLEKIETAFLPDENKKPL